MRRAAILLAGLMAAALPPRSALGAEIIRVCQHYPITGTALTGRNPDRFGKFYFDYVNAELGGVNGHPVEFVTYDDRYNPPFAITAAESCRARGAHIVVGPAGRDQLVAVSKWAERKGVPYLHGSFAAVDAYQGAFIGPTDEQQSRALADLLVANAESMTGIFPPVFGMVRMASPFYQPAHDAFAARLAEHGYALEADLVVQRDENDFGAEWAELQASRVSIVHNLTPSLTWLKMANQQPASYRPIWAVIGAEHAWNVVREFMSDNFVSPSPAVVLHGPSPVYDETDDSLGWAAEIRRFKQIYDRYAPVEEFARRDDLDWASYVRAKQIHRFLLALGGNHSPAHVAEVLRTYSETSDQAYPACALEFSSTPGIGAHRWHVFSSNSRSWNQAAFCASKSDAPPVIDFAGPLVDCGPPAQLLTAPLICSVSDAHAGVGEYTVNAQGPLGSAPSQSGSGACRPQELFEHDLPPGVWQVTVEARDCAGNVAASQLVALRAP